ncbi:uncharacterized protein LOC144320574 isoform X2 [Canis aureus]
MGIVEALRHPASHRMLAELLRRSRAEGPGKAAFLVTEDTGSDLQVAKPVGPGAVTLPNPWVENRSQDCGSEQSKNHLQAFDSHGLAVCRMR